MNKILKKLNVLLDKKQKMQMAGLVVLMFIGAFLEAFSIAAIVPVVTIVLTPDAVEESKIISGWLCRVVRSLVSFHLPRV